MTAARASRPVPYDEFLIMEKASEDRHEWVDGAVYAMSRGSPEHGRLTGRVIAGMLNPLLEEGCEIFSSDAARQSIDSANATQGPSRRRTARRPALGHAG
jgi:hypothetical protein